MKNNKGFALVEGLLVLVIVGMLTGIGWYVWNANNKTNDTLANTDAASSSVAKSAKKQSAAQNDDTKSWLLYESPTKEYKIRLADGWKLQRFSTSSNIYAWNASDINLKSGTQATVEQVEGGRDGGNIAFSLRVIGGDESPPVRTGTKQQSLKTNQGLDVEKYTYTQTTDPEGPGLQKGSTEYMYIVSKGSTMVTIYHDQAPTDPDNVALVEKVIKTLEI